MHPIMANEMTDSVRQVITQNNGHSFLTLD